MSQTVDIAVPEVHETMRSPTDALRFATSTLVAIGTFFVVLVFPDVFGGLGLDLSEVFENPSDAEAEIAGLILTTIVLLVPVILAITFLWHREFRRLATVLLAAIAGALATWLVIQWLIAILGDSFVPSTDDLVVVAKTAYYPYVASITAAIGAAAPWMTRRWERVSWASLGLMVIIRLIVGSNLPAELVLALALGAAAGAGILFAFGSPSRQPTGLQIVETLRRSGIEPIRIDAADVDARGSAPYFVTTSDDRRIFAKTLSTDERSADILFRVYCRFRFTNIGDEPGFPSLRRAVEHEALLSLSATAAGVRTPELVAVGRIGDKDYSMLLAQRAIDGRSLDSVDTEELTDEVLTGVWEQIAILRASGIAHRDLRLANVLLDDTGRPWIIDCGFSELAASKLLLDNDVAQLITSSALVVGPERAVACAVSVLGTDAVASATRRVQGPALSGATKAVLSKRDDDLAAQPRTEIPQTTGTAPPPLDRIKRLRPVPSSDSPNPSEGATP